MNVASFAEALTQLERFDETNLDELQATFELLGLNEEIRAFLYSVTQSNYPVFMLGVAAALIASDYPGRVGMII